MQVEPVEHRLVVGVAEPDVVEADIERAGWDRQRGARRGIGDGSPRVDDLENTLDGRPRLLTEDQQERQRPGRCDELRQVEIERHEDTEGDVAVQGQVAAQREHADLPDGGHRGQTRVEPGRQPHRPHPVGVQPRRAAP